MNKTKIEYVDYTWNPVTGCFHGCPYCYARRIANRFKPKYPLGDDCIQPDDDIYEIRYKSQSFKYGFYPTFHSYRLNEPVKVQKPSRIFVSSMGDLFGEWVHPRWIRDVLAVCEECKQHTFLFLTKNPRRYIEFIKFKGEVNRIDFPGNCWVGTTITNQKDADERLPLLCKSKASVKFVSYEPMMGRVDISLWTVSGYEEPPFDDVIDWVIIGAMTGPGAIKPKPEWIESIIKQCRDAGVPLFIKDNVRWPVKIQEFPV